jgi:hypothetical protein
MTIQKINQLGWESLNHPPYSPDCAPSDYHLFASLAHSLSGKKFANLTEVKKHLRLYFASKSYTYTGLYLHSRRGPKLGERNLGNETWGTKLGERNLGNEIWGTKLGERNLGNETLFICI